MIAYLGLGSNLGDRASSLQAALAALAAAPGIRVLRCTPFRSSEPWGDADQPDFLNAVAELETSLRPHALLGVVKGIERELGRRPTRRWGPRVIDLDILTWGNERLRSATLTIPHPHLLDRSFVVEPLAELAPDLVQELRRDAALPLRSPRSGR